MARSRGAGALSTAQLHAAREAFEELKPISSKSCIWRESAGCATRSRRDARPKCCSSPTATKYRRCRNSILILYRDWSDSKDILDVLTTPFHINPTELNGCNKKSKGRIDTETAYRCGVSPLLCRPLCNGKSLRRQRDLTSKETRYARSTTIRRCNGAWLFAERLLQVDWLEERALS
jgi:hypothetical protein